MASGNLSHTVQRFLYNSLSTADFGVYTDPVTSVKQLFIKGWGFILPAVNEDSIKETTNFGTYKSVYVTHNTVCPASTEFGLEIESKFQYPGVFKYYLPIRKFYGADFGTDVVCSGNVLDSTQVNQRVRMIISEIQKDILGTPMAFGLGKIVDQYNRIVMTPDPTYGGMNYAFTYTHQSLATGIKTDIAVTSAAPANIAALIVDINADIAGYGYAYLLGATQIVITPLTTYNCEFTLSSTGNILSASYINRTVTVDSETSRAGAMVSAASMSLFTITGAAAAHTLSAAIYNAETGATINAALAVTHTTGAVVGTLLGIWNAAISTYGYFVAVSATQIMFIAKSGYYVTFTTSTAATVTAVTNNLILLTSKQKDTQFNVKFSDGYATVTSITQGVWPRLTSEDVAREFSIKPWQHGSQPNVPIKGAQYTKYILTATMGDIADVSAPNRGASFLQKVELYIKSDQLTGDIWNSSDYTWESAADNAGLTPDRTFDEMLTYWKA